MQNTSNRAANMVGSEIIKLAGEVNQKIAEGKTIYNLTIGDFDPEIFPIPDRLEKLIVDAYRQKKTNYPPANGIAELRKAVSDFLNRGLNLTYDPNNILIAGGGRPHIYACYQTLVEEGDTVLYPIPSWNNNHYTYLSGSKGVAIEAKAENAFMPTADELAPHIGNAGLIALCSPLNPTGTSIGKDQMAAICNLVISENEKRKAAGKRPVYVLYDQIYWVLTYGETTHYHPVGLDERMRDYTIYVDGISKAFAATGVRVGWACGPKEVIDKMKLIISHIGAWSPKPEQWATANFLNELDNVSAYLTSFKDAIWQRLEGLYAQINTLKNEGFDVECIAPQAAIYLTVKIGVLGKTTSSGQKLTNAEEIAFFLINEAGVAIVPFYAFGGSRESEWFRISVGTIRVSDIAEIGKNLKKALSTLQ